MTIHAILSSHLKEGRIYYFTIRQLLKSNLYQLWINNFYEQGGTNQLPLIKNISRSDAQNIEAEAQMHFLEW